MNSIIVAYIPVLHQGYYQLFSQNPTANTLYILPSTIAQEFTPVHKELRALAEEHIKQAVVSWGIFAEVTIATPEVLNQLNARQATVIIPDEVVTTEVAQKYLNSCTIEKSSIFLRWDKKSAAAELLPNPDQIISSAEVDKKFMGLASLEGNKSSDWWRQVGTVAVRENTILAQTHNTHLPSEQQPYAEGDARAHFHKGDHIELTTAIHAEAKLIAEAAAQGLSLAEADLYVTDFPCPPCAKLIAHAGIKRLFYQKGYAMLDGERVLKQAGVELIRVSDTQ